MNLALARISAGVALLSALQIAMAEAEPQRSVPTPTPMPMQAPTPLNGKALFPGVRPMPKAALSDLRGGTDTTAGTNLSATVAGSSATNVATGVNSIADGAFSGSSGLSVVVQNSGNNVVIQTSTIVNITVK